VLICGDGSLSYNSSIALKGISF